MDDRNDVYNGSLAANTPIINEADVLDYEAIIEKLEADVEEARQAAIELATGYCEFATLLGFDMETVLAGGIKHETIVNRLKAVIGIM
jgi:hypothetical protein